jgi:ATP-dependent DNA helicase UvrD/PcrA
VIDLAQERFTKNLWSDCAFAERPRFISVRDEAAQARYVVEKVLEHREAGVEGTGRSVPRLASHGPLEVELTRCNIPFIKFGALKFLEAAHIKDVLALLRWAENPRGRVAGFRVLSLASGRRPRLARPTGSRSRQT